MKKCGLVSLITVILLLSACGTNEEVQEKQGSKSEENALYKSDSFTVFHVEGWSLEKESTDKTLNVIFSKDQSKAIITSLSVEKSNEEIKNDLINGAGNVEIIVNKDDNVSFKTKLNNSIRTDIFIKKSNKHKIVITFMTPDSNYENAKKDKEEFLNKVEVH